MRLAMGSILAAIGLAAVFALTGCLQAAKAPSSGNDVLAGSIVAFGDSYTEGHGTTPEGSYPARLALALQRPVVNRGVTGETAAEARSRLERDVLRHDPELVIVEFGVNEAFRGRPVAESLRDIEAITTEIQSKTDAKIVLVGVRFWDFQQDFDDGLRDIARRHSTGLVVDVLHGIVSSRRDRDDGDATLRSDAFHPNAAGYAIMAQRIEPAVRQALDMK